jgi:hypothetical protein
VLIPPAAKPSNNIHSIEIYASGSNLRARQKYDIDEEDEKLLRKQKRDNWDRS